MFSSKQTKQTNKQTKKKRKERKEKKEMCTLYSLEHSDIKPYVIRHLNAIYSKQQLKIRKKHSYRGMPIKTLFKLKKNAHFQFSTGKGLSPMDIFLQAQLSCNRRLAKGIQKTTQDLIVHKHKWTLPPLVRFKTSSIWECFCRFFSYHLK